MCSISDLTRSHVERREGILRLERKNKDTSVQTKIKSIRTFLYWCMDEGRGWLEPFSITLPRADMTLKEPYTKDELTALLAPPANEDLSEWRNWAAVGFISRTGVRLSSAVNLKWTDIDFEKHICLLRHTKTNEQYFVPIPSAALTDLLTWKAIARQQQKATYSLAPTRKRSSPPMPSLRPSGYITSLVESRKRRFTCSGTPLQRCIYRREEELRGRKRS